MIDLAVLVVKGVIIGKIPGDGRHLDILHRKLHIRDDALGLVGVQDLAQILPAAGGGKLHAVGGIFDAVEVFLLEVEVRDHRAVQALSQRVVLPDGEVFLHVDALNAVERHHIEVPHRTVVLRRVARGDNEPALGQALVDEGLALQKLEHHRGQGLGHAVDLVEEQNALADAGFLGQGVHRAQNLAHGVLGDGVLHPVIDALFNEGQAHGALAGVVGDGVGHQSHVFLGGDLLHDLGLADARRAHQQNGALPHGGDAVIAQRVPAEVSAQGVADLFLGLFDVHKMTS